MEAFAEWFRQCVLYVASSMLGLTVCAGIVVLIYKSIDTDEVKRIIRFLFRPTFSALLAWLCVVPLVCTLIVHGAEKSGGGTNDAPSRMSSPRRSPRQSSNSAITQEDIARGYRVSEALIPEGLVDISDCAVTNDFLRKRGGFDWAFRVEPVNWRFPYRDGFLTGVTVFARGEVRPDVGTLHFPVPVAEGVSLLPEARWGVLPDGEGSIFRHAVTENRSLVLDWRNALVAREAASVTNFQFELFGDGRFALRSQGGAQLYLPVLPFDWDGDGLENSVDPDPFSENVSDAHGTNDEWMRVVCSNLFHSVGGALCWKDDVNTNAYYFAEVVASDEPAPIYFNADRDSRLGSPVVVARGGETNLVPLLVGVEYVVTSTVPISVSAPDAAHAEISSISDKHHVIKWPLDFEFFERETAQGRSYCVVVVPYDPGGEFVWEGSGGRASLMSASLRTSCSCASGIGSTVLFSCSDVCPCGGNCVATGEYRFESAVFSLTGGVCRCGFEDPPHEERPHHDPLDGPSFSISFSNSAILFEDTYRDYPGDFKPRSSTRVRLTISAYGGPNGGRFTTTTSNLEKISPVACGPMVIPTSMDLNAGESYYASFLCEAQEASSSANDVEVSGEFVETGTSETIRPSAALTVIGLEVRATINPPDEDYGYVHRHEFGVCEEVLLKQSPSSPTVLWNPVGGGSNTVEQGGTRYFCPLYGCNNPVVAECGGARYTPHLSVIEPSSVKAELLYGRTRDSVMTYTAAKGQSGGIGMMLRLYVRPFSVSFTGIAIEEVPQLTYRTSGYFSNPYYNGAFAHTVQAGAGNWLKVQEDNSFATDEAAFTHVIPWLTPQGVISTDPVYAWTDGYAYMDNPFGWGQIDSQNGDPPYTMFATDTEDEFILYANGTLGVRKLFNQITRTTNDVIRLNGVLIQ